ncbi:MAG: RidA family protein [Thermomicrobiales bacterium]
MTTPTFFVTPGYGDRQRTRFHYSQGVRIGNRVELSGQGGWNDDWVFPDTIEEEISQAFRNVARTLAVVGAGWEHVIHVNSYHVGLDGQQDAINAAMVSQFRAVMPDHAPIWTCLGVAALGDPAMRVEIRVTAILPD